jgi:hypothetical protein
MLLVHGVFGIGGLIGPVIVYIFEDRSFIVIGVLVLLMAPFYYFLPSPEDLTKK